MKHKWLGGEANNLRVCFVCGLLKYTKQTHRKFISSYHRENGLVSSGKTPPCDGIWPKGWKPYDRHVNYDLMIGQHHVLAKNVIRLKTFKEAQDQIDRFGTPTRIISNYKIDDDHIFDFLKWLIENCDFYPPKFMIMINDTIPAVDLYQSGNEWKIQYQKDTWVHSIATEKELEKTFSLIRNIVGYARLTRLPNELPL